MLNTETKCNSEMASTVAQAGHTLGRWAYVFYSTCSTASHSYYIFKWYIDMPQRNALVIFRSICQILTSRFSWCLHTMIHWWSVGQEMCTLHLYSNGCGKSSKILVKVRFFYSWSVSKDYQGDLSKIFNFINIFQCSTVYTFFCIL